MTRRTRDRLRGALAWLAEDADVARSHVLLNVVAGSALVPRDLRWVLYRLAGVRTGRANVYPHVRLRTSRLTLGREIIVNQGCRFDNLDHVTLGDGVSVGQEVLFVTSTHVPGDARKRAAEVVTAPISVGAGAWLGARSTLLPGVSVGEGCIVAAGSVVTSDCAPHGLYAGVPAVRKRELAPPATAPRPAAPGGAPLSPPLARGGAR